MPGILIKADLPRYNVKESNQLYEERSNDRRPTAVELDREIELGNRAGVVVQSSASSSNINKK